MQMERWVVELAQTEREVAPPMRMVVMIGPTTMPTTVPTGMVGLEGRTTAKEVTTTTTPEVVGLWKRTTTRTRTRKPRKAPTMLSVQLPSGKARAG
jgi:hypothetical protein